MKMMKAVCSAIETFIRLISGALHQAYFTLIY